MLDQEASEDEGIRKNAAKDGWSWDRQPSYEANIDLTNKERRYRQMLDHATESDETVRQKWEEWEEAVTRLTWEEVQRQSITLKITFLNDLIIRKTSNSGFHRLQCQQEVGKMRRTWRRRITLAHCVCIWKRWTTSGRPEHKSFNVLDVWLMQTISNPGSCVRHPGLRGGRTLNLLCSRARSTMR